MPAGPQAATQQATVTQAAPWWNRDRSTADDRRATVSAQRGPAIGSSSTTAGRGAELSTSRPRMTWRSSRGASVGTRWPTPGSVCSVAEGNIGRARAATSRGTSVVPLSPHQIDRAADGGHRLGVLLGQQPHEHVAHHPGGRPVVGGPVPASHLPPSVGHPTSPSGGAGGPSGRRRRAGSAGPGGRARGTPVSTSRSIRSGTRAPSRTATRPPNEWPTTTTRSARAPGSSNRGSRWRAYSLGPPRLGWRRGGPEAEQVEADGADRASGRVVRCRTRRTKSWWVRRQPWRASTVGTPTPRFRRTGDRRRTTSAPAHPTDSLASRGTTGAHRGRVDPSAAGRRRRLRPGPGRSHRVPTPGGGLTRPTPLCIMAGAGSGKTRVLTLRVARRIRDGSRPTPTTPWSAPSPARPPASSATGSFATAWPCPPRPRPGRTRPRGAGRDPPPAGAHPAPAPGPRRRSVRPRWWPTTGTGRSRDLVGDPAVASAVDTEIGWAKARCLTARRPTPAAAPGRGSAGGHLDRPGGRRPSPPTRPPCRRRRMLDLDDVLLRAADLLSTTPASPSGMHGGTGTCRSTSSRT